MDEDHLLTPATAFLICNDSGLELIQVYMSLVLLKTSLKITNVCIIRKIRENKLKTYKKTHELSTTQIEQMSRFGHMYFEFLKRQLKVYLKVLSFYPISFLTLKKLLF